MFVCVYMGTGRVGRVGYIAKKDLKPTIPCSQGRAFSAYIFHKHFLSTIYPAFI